MARAHRLDPPGTWHHVWGRGLSHKPIFEDRRDIRRFQVALARAVRRGEIEVHSFTFLPTHFHLLVRSPKGMLSRALARVLSDFTRYFNRRRKRDGTVWRGRFSSKPVPGLCYRRVLVRYIDQNPVQARLAPVPWRYEHGSAQRFVFKTPRWLSRAWIDEVIQARTGRAPGDGGRYEEAFPVAGDATRALVEARERSAVDGPDPLDDLLGASPTAIRQWLENQSKLADGRKSGSPVLAACAVSALLLQLEEEHPGWRIRPPRGVPATRIIGAALLRDLAGLTFREIGRALEVSPAYAKKLCGLHAVLLGTDSEYSQRVVELARRGLASAYEESGELCLTPE